MLSLYDLCIHIAPAPIFVGFNGLDDGVLGLMKVFGRMFVLGLVAAADVPAGEAQTQVNPGFAHFQTFLTARAARRDRADLVQMSAI